MTLLPPDARATLAAHFAAHARSGLLPAAALPALRADLNLPDLDPPAPLRFEQIA